MKLSVLDQGIIAKGETAEQALAQTVALAKAVDELGITGFGIPNIIRVVAWQLLPLKSSSRILLLLLKIFVSGQAASC